MPVGAELDDFVVEVGGDAAAEGDDHAFAAIDGLALLEVGDDVVGDGFEALGGADDRFDFGLVGFGLLGAAEVFKAEVFVEFVQ